MTDYTKVCRVCLEPESDFIGYLLPIEKTRIHLNTISLTDVLEMFIKFKLHTDERLPQRICTTCIKDITAGYTFKLKCETAERFLLKKLLNITPTDVVLKKDACTSTIDIEPVVCNEPVILEENPNPQPEPVTDKKTFQPNQNICEIDNEIIGAARAQNIIQNYPPTIVSHNEYKPVIQAQGNCFQVSHDPHSGQNIYNINVPTYTPSYANNYTGYFSQNYTPNYTQEYSFNSQNAQAQYIDKIETEDHQLMDAFDNIIEHDPSISETEDISHENYDEDAIANVKETKDAVNSISTRSKKRKQTSKEPEIKKKRTRGPNKKPAKRKQPLCTATLDCVACSEKHETRESLETHFLNQHTHGRFCTVCNKEIMFSMRRHLSIHFKLERVQCPKCPKAVKSEFALLQHLTMYHPTYECPTCFSKFDNQEELDAHMEEHAKLPTSAAAMTKNEYELMILCEGCNELFDGIKVAKEHFLNVHIDDSYCKACEKHLTSQTIQNHIKNHFEMDMHCCSICCKRYKRKEGLKKHQQDMHNIYGICEFCLQDVTSKEELDKHIKEHEIFGTNNRHQCQICGLKCSSFTALSNHQDYHELEQYRCKDCFHLFRREYDLKKHLTLKHKLKCIPSCKQCVLKV